jgi:hypothetical protein
MGFSILNIIHLLKVFFLKKELQGTGVVVGLELVELKLLWCNGVRL